MVSTQLVQRSISRFAFAAKVAQTRCTSTHAFSETLAGQDLLWDWAKIGNSQRARDRTHS
jgi:hypothetical protein